MLTEHQAVPNSPTHRTGPARRTAPHASRSRIQLAAAFLITGGACVIAGGLTAAIIAHAPSEHATWAAADLVLVAGAAQIGLGVGRAWLADQKPSPGRLIAELGSWNLGNAAVIAGTLSGLAAVVDLGGTLLVVALTLLLAAVRDRRRSGWPLALYRGLIVILLASIPIGLILAELKTSYGA